MMQLAFKDLPLNLKEIGAIDAQILPSSIPGFKISLPHKYRRNRLHNLCVMASFLYAKKYIMLDELAKALDSARRQGEDLFLVESTCRRMQKDGAHVVIRRITEEVG
jgi:hypothetical protein